jgi:peptide/nickel transport system permease protein
MQYMESGCTSREVFVAEMTTVPTDIEVEQQEKDEGQGLSYWQLVIAKFKKNKMAIAAGIFLILFYLVMVFFPEFFAPYAIQTRSINHINAPPQRIRFFDVEGRFHIRPFVYGLDQTMNKKTFRREYTLDTSTRYHLTLFSKGDPVSIFGVIPIEAHFIGVQEGGTIFLFGTDRQGRDLFSRILYGGRISLTVGLVGATLTMFLGTFLGIFSGYFGGLVDNMVQRIIEFLMSLPAIPLWMALAAALPPEWSSIKTYFGITIILSIIGWGSLARQIRGKALSLREEEYVLAAKAMGVKQIAIISNHLFPSCMSHVIVIATLTIPGMILGETSLSFLGLGIKPPMTSWGVLLMECQNVRAVAQTPWLLIPVLFIVGAVLSFNFVGDGLRDAADPFTRI